VVNGTYSITLPWGAAVTLGTHSIVVNYSGDTSFAAGMSPVATLVISKGVTTTTLSVPATARQYDFPVVTATVTPTYGGIPTGTVTFLKEDGTSWGTGTLNSGVATLRLISDPANPERGIASGIYKFTASYSGDSTFSASTSMQKTMTVSTAAPDFRFTADTTGIAVKAGNQAVAHLTLYPVNFPEADVNFTCANVPAYVTCTITPNTFTFISKGQVANKVNLVSNDPTLGNLITIAVNTNQMLIGSVTPGSGPANRLVGLSALAMLCPGLVFAGSLFSANGRKKGLRRNVLLAIAVIALLTILLGLPGCGGSLTKVNPVTPTGSSTITIVGTMSNGGNMAHSLVMPITVQ
jgi:hypothetical protein